MMATFILDECLEKQPPMRQFTNIGRCLPENNPYKKSNLLVYTEPEGGQVVRPVFNNSFISAIYQAYQEHRHLVLSPDDVWLAITVALGWFVNGHAEKMRNKFVSHEEKMTLTAFGGTSIYDTNWNDVIDQLSDLIDKNTKGDVSSWLEPDFSTTTPVAKTVGKAVLMGVMKKYFTYKMMCVCGIPKVTLKGTVDDWKKLRAKAQMMTKYDTECLTHWLGLLDPVLAEFEAASSGNINLEFWRQICHVETWRRGYGGPTTTISGWINVFMPFDDKHGNYRLNGAQHDKQDWGKSNTKNIPSGLVEVPIMIGNDSVTLYGGHIACVYNEADDSIRPSLDWAIIDKSCLNVKENYMPGKFVYGA